MRRNHLLFIKDILEAMRRIEEFITSLSFEEFQADDKVKSAVVWKLVVIGEATKNIPAQIRDRYPHIPWSSMARMRDRLAHGYFTVDDEIVWKVVKEELPALRPHIEEVYERERRYS
jgi:uncharacterized protein with HEPN domain